jgi:hypothetical protein
MRAVNETCEQCRFDGSSYTAQDVVTTLLAIDAMWRDATAGIDDPVLTARPAPGVWSALEYAAHSRDQIGMMGKLLHAVLTVDDLVLDDPTGGAVPEPEPGGDMAAVLDGMRANTYRIHDKARHLDAAAWRRTFTIDGAERDAGWVVRHAIHDTFHHLQDVGRGLHALGAGAPAQEGAVVQINTSGGGVPKLAVDEVEVGYRGLLGDRQAARKHHGRPFQALCLWSADVIGALQSEGHPVAPGLAGENLTISGLDWSTLRPGVRVLAGEVLAEISAYATPCKKNAAWFAGGDFNRMQQERHPGWSRLYAWVLEPGRIRTGDAVLVEP